MRRNNIGGSVISFSGKCPGKRDCSLKLCEQLILFPYQFLTLRYTSGVTLCFVKHAYSDVKLAMPVYNVIQVKLQSSSFSLSFVRPGRMTRQNLTNIINQFFVAIDIVVA